MISNKLRIKPSSPIKIFVEHGFSVGPAWEVEKKTASIILVHDKFRLRSTVAVDITHTMNRLKFTVARFFPPTYMRCH